MTKPKLYWLDPDRNLVIKDSVLQTLSSDYKRVFSVKLHASPPKREWVGLTDDEIFKTHKQVDSMQYLTFGKAIEAKLKEKNT
jgi:hypothetical protein